MIYIVDSCYVDNHKDACIIVKSKNLCIEEMTEIVGALGNLCSSCNGDRGCVPQTIFNVLIEHFGCKDRKHKYHGELGFIALRVQSPMLHTTFVLRDEFMVWIDIEEAMRYTSKRFRDILSNYFTQEEMDEVVEKWRRS